MEDLKIKVCGMKHLENIQELVQLQPNYMGFIFYPPSKRYVGETLSHEVLDTIPDSIIKTGVFVNESTEKILQIADRNKLAAIQLHGKESPEQCKEIQNQKLVVFKAFSVDNEFDFNTTEKYANCADYFLFDTKCPQHGGSGQKFDWQLLQQYIGSTPFFLSGGIGAEDIDKIKALHLPQLFALDVNSKFEIEPALKNIALLENFIQKIKQ